MPLTSTFDDAPQHNHPSGGLPSSVASRGEGQWHLQGTGLFRWSVFRVYEASLFVQAPLSAEAIADCFDELPPFALVLNYLRNVSAAQIASTSVSEMIRLRNVDPIVAAQWGQQMAELLPDVSLGDKLIGLFKPGQGVVFYANASELGEVAHTTFVSSFASVWLDPNTKAPALRASLLGLQNEALS
ncbi:MAG: chalcone isomerase family protein [Orrella sp.]